MTKALRAVVLLIVGSCVTLACGPDAPPPGAFVGAPCHSDYDCGGLYCVDVAGGTCQLACRGDAACGPGYSCRSQGRRGAGGKVDVCLPN
jgi:hypothetical protein